MDRNSILGFVLIALILMVYFQYTSSPTPPPETTEKTENVDSSKVSSTTSPTSIPTQTATVDSLDSGEFSILKHGNEEKISLENNQVRFTFSNHAFLTEVELKEYKTYIGQPLKLIANGDNLFRLKATTSTQTDIDFFSLFYTSEISKKADTTILLFTANLNETTWIKHRYFIPTTGYLIGYELQSNGLTFSSPATLEWIDPIALQEKDIEDSRTRTTINYYTPAHGFDELSKTSNDSKVFADQIKWLSIKQKFFTSAIISHDTFSGGEIAIEKNDSPVLKTASLKLFIPTSDIMSGKRFDYFFGPNDYKVLRSVYAEDFSKNLYMGWPPVVWVNKFVIIPIFNFLEQYIGNYGVIIMLLVLFIKIVLSPLSYKSYLGMAKMRLLKPELDAIKEKNGDNMTQTQQDQMKLYRQAGVNPFSGCIPMVLQMPVLFAMFYFFPVSIQLRQKSFLWAEDLSTYDSFLNLPFTIPFYGNHVSLFVLLMTASTIIYTWQNNQISSVQGPMKSMMYVMPVMFMFILNSFSAGLSFYYFVSNIITFTQQAIIKRFVDEEKVLAVMEENKRNAAAGKTKKSKFMAKLDDAMKASELARKQKNKQK